VAVSAAAGAAGCGAVQLLRRAGATVVAITSEANHAWLAGKGAIPIAYGPDLRRDVETFHLDAFIDLHGPHYLDLAIELGVPPSRINTIISFAKAASFVARTDGSMAGTGRIMVCAGREVLSPTERTNPAPSKRWPTGCAPAPT